MTLRVRFAPSPTGNVHIGNIRAAIFNWLYARHEKGTFLLRIEDTDLERSTPEAIATLLQAMKWLNLDYDEPIMYQTAQSGVHAAAAKKLIEQGDVYSAKPDPKAPSAPVPKYFRIPWDVTRFAQCTRCVGPTELSLHPDVPFVIDFTGVSYAQMSRKGKPSEEKASLAGFTDLKLYNAQNECIFTLDKADYPAIAAGEKSFEIKEAVRATFVRYEVFFNDLVKGELAKPLDTVRDFVVIRSDNSPVFHLANVCDDITQEMTHIIRGDDHVENTYRHLYIFLTLGVQPPHYAHLPMIVNREGKPYSKRDGDAFVGDFETNGFLPEALFNYLTLLGWSPGDGREKMSRQELIDAFTLDRVSSAPAQLDIVKLQSLNQLYLNDLSESEFLDYAWNHARSLALPESERAHFDAVARLMRSRTRCAANIATWAYFFAMPYPTDEKALTKTMSQEKATEALQAFARLLRSTDVHSAETYEHLLRQAAAEVGADEGKVHQVVRITVTGAKGGAELDQTLALIARDEILKRLEHAQA